MDVTTESNSGKQKQQSRKKESIKKEWMEEGNGRKNSLFAFLKRKPTLKSVTLSTLAPTTCVDGKANPDTNNYRWTQ